MCIEDLSCITQFSKQMIFNDEPTLPTFLLVNIPNLKLLIGQTRYGSSLDLLLIGLVNFPPHHKQRADFT